MKPIRPPQQTDTHIQFDRRTGGLLIVSSDATAGFDFEVNGQFAGAHVPVMTPVSPGRVNRIMDSGLELPESLWRTVKNGAEIPVRKNIHPDWTLAGGNTAYLESTAGADEAPVKAAFNCPVEGPEIRVDAGFIYSFQALIGLHRADGRVRLVFLDGKSNELQAFEKIFLDSRMGGKQRGDYDSVHLAARAPAGAARLRIEIVKGLTAVGADSFLFFSLPSLRRAAEAIDVEKFGPELPDEVVVELFNSANDRFHVGNVPVPGEALDGGFHRVAVRNRATSNVSNSIPVALPDSVRCSATIHGLEGSTLIARIELPRTWTNAVSVSLWIDGQVVPGNYYSAAGTGQSRLPLPVSCCDGRPHLFALRLGQSGQLLGQFAAMGPIGLTPWPALQKYSGMPLPAHLAPLAAYRYASLAAADHAAIAKGGPSLHQLHAIVVQGFEPRRKEFPVLPFPEVKDPDVSIVIPVHDKFDVTYVCLAALLLAANKASFEVIVVDDGSADTTAKAESIAPGIVYVRNDKALGFVGACNAGADVARGRYIVFLNNDTEPTAHWLDELLFVFDNFDNVGLAGCKLIYPDGVLQEAGGIVWETGDPWNYGRRGNPSDPRFSYTRICDYLSGAAIMIPRDLWRELGGFSKEFAPAYFEDTDLAFKVKNAGKRVVFAPASLVIHYEGLSNGTDNTASSGLKRFQEINRPKFKRKWSALFHGNGKVGLDADLAKDRGIAKRVVFFDAEFPRLDRDAGSYAAIQEIRMFQALGCKVTYVPTNMAYAGRHTAYLQRLGVETIHVPFYPDTAAFLRERGREFDLAYVTRYGVAEKLLGPLAEFARQARVVINVADLHFLRLIRDAIAEKNPVMLDAAVQTRDAEVAALRRAELVLTYSTVEQAVISSHVPRGPKTGILPWVIDKVPVTVPFAARRDLAFIGGFGHTPNAAAVKYFAEEVMPLLRTALPGVRFLVYGSAVTPDVEALASGDVIIKGYVKDISEVFDTCRVFVAPLLSGAGMKGKVMDCIAAGIPSVLSPVAAEAIGLRDGLDAIIARRPEDWVDGILRLYQDEAAWTAMSKSVHNIAEQQFSFKAGVAALSEALASIEFFLAGGKPALHVTSARPPMPAGAPAPRHDGTAIVAI